MPALPDIRQGLSRRAIGVVAALAIELLLLLVLLSLGMGREAIAPPGEQMTTFEVGEPPAASAPAPVEQASPLETPQDVPQPEPEAQLPTALPRDFVFPIPGARPSAAPQPAPTPAPSPSPSSRIGAVVRPGANYGPADSGRRAGSEDSEVVGTAPDGSPLYAARWFREPYPGELAGYLSTASGPGWGLIACRTAPNWRVEDCQVVSEYPQGSGIARATQAAAWQFQVRPPRLGGEYQVGAWVRIRMDYTRDRVAG